DDLFTQQVQLLEHGLQRQAGVVHEPQLTLVVTGVLTEAEGLLDDLLRRTDAERGAFDEVLQRGAVAIDRGVVEVGTELSERILALLGDERLTAEPDNRLVGLAVAVVL